MGIIAKAAPILSEENLIDIIPVAWELIMETDQELAASAGNINYFFYVWVCSLASRKCLKLTFMILCNMLWR